MKARFLVLAIELGINLSERLRATIPILVPIAICSLVFSPPGHAQLPLNVSSIVDNDDGLLAGTDLLSAEFGIL